MNITLENYNTFVDSNNRPKQNNNKPKQNKLTNKNGSNQYFSIVAISYGCKTRMPEEYLSCIITVI
jgi:hypothetical protein